MTCIVGIADGTTVWMGGDSYGSTSYTKMASVHPKVFIRETHGERVIIGWTGSFRMGQVLEHKLDIPSNETQQDAYAFMVGTVVGAVRTLLKEEGCVITKDGQDKSDGAFLFGYKGRLFKVGTDYSAIESTRGYTATGSGEETAMGALYVLPDAEPEARIMAALEAAAEIVPSVGGPFYVAKLEAL